MSDPVDDILTRGLSKSHSRVPYDKHDQNKILDYIQQHLPRLAIVTGLDDPDPDSGQVMAYLVDIYDNGYQKDPTQQDISCYSIDPKISYAPDRNGDWGIMVRVIVLPSGDAVFMPNPFIMGFGKYKVAMIGDNLIPGTWIADYPRFHSPPIGVVGD